MVRCPPQGTAIPVPRPRGLKAAARWMISTRMARRRRVPRRLPGFLRQVMPIGHLQSSLQVHTSMLEHFPFSYAGSTALRGTSNGEKPRGLKPAAQNTETGNALAAGLTRAEVREG